MAEYAPICRRHSAPRNLCGCAPAHRQPEPATVTPPWLAALMLDKAGYANGERLLDPCAGTGTLLEEAAGRSNVPPEFIELNAERAAALHARGYAGRHGDMRLLKSATRYHVVALNPDFRHWRWIGMVAAAYRFVQPGCTLVAVVPTMWQQLPAAEDLQGALDASDFGNMLHTAASYTAHNLPVSSFVMGGQPVLTSVLVVERRPE